MPSITIATEVDVFVRHIDSMYDTLDFLMDGISRLHKPSVKALKEFLEEKCEKKADENGKIFYVVPPAQLQSSGDSRRGLIVFLSQTERFPKALWFHWSVSSTLLWGA